MTKNTRLYYCSSSSGVDSINSAAEAFEAAPKIGDMIKEDGSTLLHDAALGKQTRIAPDEMIDHLVVVDKLNKDNCTALDLAIYNGKLLDLIPRMIDNMSQKAIEAASSVDGNTALHYAIDQGRFDIAEKLIARVSSESVTKENHYKSEGVDRVQISVFALADHKSRDASTKLANSVAMKESAKYIQHYAQKDLGYSKLTQKLREKLSVPADRHFHLLLVEE